MKATIYAAILDGINADAALVTILGGQNVFVRQNELPPVFPCVTLNQSGGGTLARSGYNSQSKREDDATLTVDVWSKVSVLQTLTITDRLDSLLAGATYGGTRLWEKTTDSDQVEEDPTIYHKTMRWGFSYEVDDS